MLRYVLLTLLRDGTPEHGYGLMKHYRLASGIRLSIGNIYRELQRLAALEWVRAVPRADDVDPRRLPYQITDTGGQALARWLMTPTGVPAGDAQDHLALRAFVVAAFGGQPAHVQVLEQYREDLVVARRLAERARAVGDGSRRAPAGWALELLAARRVDHMRVDLEFLSTFAEACAARGAETRRAVRARPASSMSSR